MKLQIDLCDIWLNKNKIDYLHKAVKILQDMIDVHEKELQDKREPERKKTKDELIAELKEEIEFANTEILNQKTSIQEAEEKITILLETETIDPPPKTTEKKKRTKKTLNL